MDVMYQVMDQMTMLRTPANRTAETQNDGTENGGFGAMVQQKRQELQGQNAQGTQKGQAAQTAETRAAEPGKATEPVTDEQYAAAAAMLYQMIPNVGYVVEVRSETAVLPAFAAVDETPAAGLPVMNFTAEAPEAQTAVPEGPVTFAAEAMPELAAEATPETAAEATPETAAVPEAVESPAVRPAQSFTAETKAPETGADAVVSEAPAEAAPAAARSEAPEQESRSFDGQQTFTPARENRAAENAAPVKNTEETEIPAEAPVFPYVEAAPVKVAEPAAVLKAPVALEAEDSVEQLGERLTLVSDFSQDGVSRAELTLVPESLGKLTVEITHNANGTLHVVLSASTAKAAALLEKNLGGLQSALAMNGKSQATIELRGGEESRQQFLNPNDQNGREQQQRQQQQQQQNNRQQHAASTQDFLQQLRLGLVSIDGISA